MKLTMGIASTGRPGIVTRTVMRLQEQSLRPDRIVICIASNTDIDREALRGLSIPIEILVSERGLTRQRNAILNSLDPDDILIFIDDDFLLAPNYCQEVLNLFNANPDIVMATGKVLADGIIGPGLTFEQADLYLRAIPCSEKPELRPVYNGYGCNMAIRASTIIENNLGFDVRLPSYGWLEDVDFSRQLSAHGRIVLSTALKGVHLGIKVHRSPGVKLGYSQVANPIYLASKGTMALHRAGILMLRNMLMNFARAFRPEPWVDRRGRLRGNLLAFGDLVTGRLCPERAGVVE